MAIGWFWASVLDGKKNQRYKDWWLERIVGDVCWDLPHARAPLVKVDIM